MKDRLIRRGLLGSLGYLATFGTFASAAESTPENKENPPQGPVKMVADQMEYNQNTGDFHASGRVRIVRDGDRLRTEVVFGNGNDGDIVFPEEVRMVRPLTVMQFGTGTYNFNSQTGEFENVSGMLKSRYFVSEHADIYPDRTELRNASIAEDESLMSEGRRPIFRIDAPSVTIIPNEKMTLNRPALYLGPHKLIQLSSYTTSLKPEDQESKFPFPKIGYDSDRGAFISYSHPFVLPRGVYFRAWGGAYTNDGFKGALSLSKGTSVGSFSLVYGQFYDSSNDYWLQLLPELTYRTPTVGLGGGWNTYLTARAGRWKGEGLDSWRYESEAWIYHRPISIFEKTLLSFGGAMRYVNEADYNNEFWQPRGYVRLETQWTADLYTSLSLEGNSENKARFKYRHTDFENSIRPFVRYQIDRRNQINLGGVYDIDNGRLAEIRTSWVYDLRGIQIELAWKRDRVRNDDKFEVNLHTRMF